MDEKTLLKSLRADRFKAGWDCAVKGSGKLTPEDKDPYPVARTAYLAGYTAGKMALALRDSQAAEI